jgi:tetratricopeptide (TPR) repeat protein
VENYYELLGVREDAGQGEIKRAFREKAKRIHPDLAGAVGEGAMRKLLGAYEVLSREERRRDYDRIFRRFVHSESFDYRRFLRDQGDDPASRAKLIFFELFHQGEEEALSIWRRAGSLDFPLDRYLDREDWMDCAFILAEELEKRSFYYDAFVLLSRIIREERRRPYFHHFIEEVECAIKELVRLRLKRAVDAETWLECLETLLGLGFPPVDQAHWLRSMAETLLRMGESAAAGEVLREALNRYPKLGGTAYLKRKLRIYDSN